MLSATDAVPYLCSAALVAAIMATTSYPMGATGMQVVGAFAAPFIIFSLLLIPLFEIYRNRRHEGAQ